MGNFLVGLLNNAATAKKVFLELFITKQNTVQFQIFDKAGLKYVSLFKREMYQLSPVILKRKINTVVANEKDTVADLETELLQVWQTVRDRAPQLYKELEQMKLGPNLYHQRNDTKTQIGSKIEITNLKSSDKLRDIQSQAKADSSTQSRGSPQKLPSGDKIRKEIEKMEKQLGLGPTKSQRNAANITFNNQSTKPLSSANINKSLGSLKELTPTSSKPAPQKVPAGPQKEAQKSAQLNPGKTPSAVPSQGSKVKQPKSIMKQTSSIGKPKDKEATKEGVRF